MRVSIFGIGYVGVVTAGCLSDQGHDVICVDVNQEKVDNINNGVAPIVEEGLDEMIRQARAQGRLSATRDHEKAIADTEISIVCVGTPSLESGRLNLKYATEVYAQICAAVETKQSKHVVIIRSTMLPGSVRNLVENYSKELIKTGSLEVSFCPEFLREGSAIQDFNHPGLAVYGSYGDKPNESLVTLMGESQLVPLEASELVKYACNYWHAVKVAFGNEIGRISKHLGVNGQHLMSIFCQDTQLNISPNYMRPGTPFGGSCLPKDVSALSAFSKQEGISLPMLESILDSNESHLDHLLRIVNRAGVRKILIIGLTFKKGTDDLRSSPMVALAETLLGKGFDVEIFDDNLELSRLTGSNQIEIDRRMPHLAARLISDLASGIKKSELVVFSQSPVGLSEAASHFTKDKVIVDVNGIAELETFGGRYEGLCWDSLGE
ncbi:nucleotide sugar dehydrogenase [Rhodopirellula bahusiensis]|uniref:UDP-glucose 6-dehydrogenase n=1 Tax=Rhodopirellula bahusiensis TaxID=2014065 RepID=A0A2G1WCH4_9BACT|nr:nucleotide sugar dehydrogenase [Rhodopirellula bahusiensis]PHQ36742.1 GDP-mannose dehydrogenase [Rhodopirellula bahusiensis]